MSVAVFIHWKEATKDNYDKMLAFSKWETDVPKGAQFHVAAFGDDGMRITDVWASAEDFDNFFQERILPNTTVVGLQGQPQVAVAPVHALFTPAFSAR